jgi:Methyltransferase domain
MLNFAVALSVSPSPFHLPSLCFSPLRYRPHGSADWSGHIPFAVDLVACLRPQVFVELGTHLGESYFAFCQGIAENGIQCKAHAVDTWRGDIHTGTYGDEVFREVDAYNRNHYSNLSKLMQMFFDEAVESFEDDSIDLLHIDGVHTYEKVKHDFETWWPKVTAGGIVLLHDSAVHDSGFGVWKLLEELSHSFWTVEFFHSNGLGVVQKPGAVPETGVLPLLFRADNSLLEGLRRYYEVCADHLQYQFWSARQARPAEWDFKTQLFWRAEGEDFTEAASVRVAHTLTADPSRVVLPVPPTAVAPIELRLDLADCPALFELHAVSLFNSQEELLWKTMAANSIDDLRQAGLQAVAVSSGSGVLVLNAPIGASFLVPAPTSAVQRMQRAGHVAVEMTGLSQSLFTSRVVAGFEQRLALQQADLSKLQTAFDQAQSLAFERRDEVERHDRALADAQRLAASKQSELESFSAALAEAQGIAFERQEQLEQYDRALGDAQRLATNKQEELESLSAALAEAQRIAFAKQEQLEQYDRALGEAQRLVTEREQDLVDLRAQREKSAKANRNLD